MCPSIFNGVWIMDILVGISLIVLYLVAGGVLARWFPVDRWWEFVLIAVGWPILLMVALVQWVLDEC